MSAETQKYVKKLIFFWIKQIYLFIYYSVIQLSIEVVLWPEALSGASGWHYILIWRREAAAGQKQQKYNQGELSLYISDIVCQLRFQVPEWVHGP